MNEASEKNLAVLIDAENISHRYIRNMLLEITRYGTPNIKRIYGDWTKTELMGWKNSLLKYALTPVQQYEYTTGKNSSDSAMIIDAMDILYTGSVDGFCLVTSDSDFTRLAVRLRESGKTVYGIGEKKTPTPFIASCSKFIYLEILENEDDAEDAEDTSGNGASKDVHQEKQVKKASEEKVFSSVTKQIKNLLKNTINDIADDDGWTSLSALGTSISKKKPEFDSRNYGFPRLSSFLKSLNIFEFENRSIGSSKNKHIYIRNKVESKPTSTKAAAPKSANKKK